MEGSRQHVWLRISKNHLVHTSKMIMNRNLLGGSRQIGYTEKLKSFHLDVKEGQAINSHHETLQTTPSKPYVLEQKLDERCQGQNKIRMALTVLFRYQRRAYASYLSYYSSNNIFCWLYVPYSAVSCLRLRQFLVIPTFCHCSLGQWNRLAV